MTIKNDILNIFSDIQTSTSTNKYEEFCNQLRSNNNISKTISEELFEVLWKSISKNSVNNKLLTWMELVDNSHKVTITELVTKNNKVDSKLFNEIDRILNTNMKLHLTRECSWLWDYKDFYTTSTQLAYRFKIFDSMRFEWKKFYDLRGVSEFDISEDEDKQIVDILEQFIELDDTNKWMIFIDKNKKVLPDGIENYVEKSGSSLTIYRIVEILTENFGVDVDKQQEAELARRKSAVAEKSKSTKFNKEEFDKLKLEDQEVLLMIENNPKLINMIKEL